MDSKIGDTKKLKEELTFFDLTNIIVGSIVGADIFIFINLPCPDYIKKR